jgi:hypothetical protein
VTNLTLSDFLDGVRGVRRSLAAAELPEDSTASHDLAQCTEVHGSPMPIEGLIAVVDLWTLIASEQLAAAAALIRSGEHVYGLFPLARSVLEHSVAVAWVLDSAVSGEDRAVRAALAIDRSNQGLVTATAHLAGESDGYRSQRQNLRRFRKDVTSIWPDGTDFGSTPASIAGQTLLGPGEQVRSFAERSELDPREWEGIYDYLCVAAVHPSLAALEFFSPHPEKGLVPAMSDEVLDKLIRPSLLACLTATTAYASYCAWDRAGVDLLWSTVETVLPAPS